jgi:Tfp pilus assembly protein PilX
MNANGLNNVGLSGGTMVARLRARAGQPAGGQASPGSRRGVAAILAMMFLIMFGSLSAAMAIASRGNMTTASTNLHVMRAQSAAETGLEVAESRLEEAAARFLMSDSNVTADFG